LRRFQYEIKAENRHHLPIPLERGDHGPPTQKSPEAVTQFQTTLPTVLTQQCKEHSSGDTLKVFAQDETRLGLLPVVRRRITAWGVQPVATVTPQFDNVYLYGAVDPTTGDSFFLELPARNSRAFQVWLDGFAAAFPESLNILVLDNGAGHKAKAVRWPSNVVAVFLPPYSPELNPMEWLWRDLKDKLADISVQTIEALSDAVCAIIQNYAHATLHSLTSFPYFVQAVATAQKALYV
jgi:transposase